MSDTEKKRLAFLNADAAANMHILTSLRTKPQTKTFNRWFDNHYRELCEAREIARREWYAVKPEPKDRRGRMIDSANGHDDLASTQAARRICEKRNWNWQTA